jgi:hypothetical protein
MIYAIQLQSYWPQPDPTNESGNSEINLKTLHVSGGNFNFASLLYLPGGKTWEDLPGAFSAQLGNPVVHRTKFIPDHTHHGLPVGWGPGSKFINYYIVTTDFDKSVLK